MSWPKALRSVGAGEDDIGIEHLFEGGSSRRCCSKGNSHPPWWLRGQSMNVEIQLERPRVALGVGWTIPSLQRPVPRSPAEPCGVYLLEREARMVSTAHVRNG